MDRFTQAAAGAVVTLHIVGRTDDGKFTAMARFQHSVVINRPAERVFAFVSDFENDPPWSGVAQVRRSPAGPVGVGTTFRLRQQFLGAVWISSWKWSATNQTT
jgi:Polyketide cyclase / dehydrase and lipid transport